MKTYIEGLETRYPDLYEMAKPLIGSFETLTLQCTHKGFNETQVELFENFHNACKEVLPKLESYDIPAGDWRKCRNGDGSVVVNEYPYYWSIFVTAMRQIAHMAALLMHLKTGALRTYTREILNLVTYSHLPALPLLVSGPHFYLRDGMISHHWIKSMLYMEIQFNIIGRADIAAQYWRQSFPHGAECDLDAAFNVPMPSWWLTIEAEKLVSLDYKAWGNETHRAADFADTLREELSPVPKNFYYFAKHFPGFVKPFCGYESPYTTKKSNQSLVLDLWEWAAIYGYIGNGNLGAGDYLVIPHNVDVFTFTTTWKEEWENGKVKGIKAADTRDCTKIVGWPWLT